MRTRTWPEILQAHGRAQRGIVRTAISGIVRTFYAATAATPAMVDVKVAVLNPVLNQETQEIEYEEMPTLPNVPVAYPGSLGGFVTFPIAKGDHVLLVFEELSNAEYRESGDVSTPGDVRRHSIGYPVAVPCVIADVVRAGAPPSGVAMGVPGGEQVQVPIAGTTVELGVSPGDFVALASKVDTELGKIKATLATGTASLTTGTVTFGTSYSNTPTGSTVVKAK